MELIDRYIHEVGRHLPRKNRADIQVELRSLLNDALEDRVEGQPSEDDVVALLKEFGRPRDVAASYYPEGQYLIGPALFPLFKMVIGIVLAAVLGAQLLAMGISVFIGQETIAPLEALGGLLNSIPAAVGMAVIVFAILQYFEVRPDTEDEPWDPRTLPVINEAETVKRGERVAGIIFGVIFLALFAAFVRNPNFIDIPGVTVFVDPILVRYFGWISLSLLVGIALDIYLLWQGRWTTAARIARIGANLFSIAILLILLQEHNAWLAERGVAGGFFDSLGMLPEDIAAGGQVITMQAFRMAFAVALVVTSAETVVSIYRLVRSKLVGRPAAISLPAQ